MKKKHLYATVILLSFLAAGIQPAFADTIYTLEPGIETDVGEWSVGNTIFTFTRDLIPGESIYMQDQVQDHEITLDGAHKTITGPSSSGVGVNIVNCRNVTIKNLNITGFKSSTDPAGAYIYGIWIQLSFNITLTNNSIWDNNYGIRLQGNYTDIEQGNTLTTNNISNNYWGIHLYLSNYNELAGNQISDNAGGIWLEGSEDNTLTSNTVTGHSASGIYLSVQSENNTLTGNISSNNKEGIKLNNSNSNTLTGSTANTNTIAGILLMGTGGSNLNTVTGNTTSNNVYGIQLTNSSNNTLTDNITNGNSNTGIWLDPSNNNTITENDISNNVRGIYILDSDDNEIYNNNFIENTTHAEVSGTSIDNVFNLALPIGGNYWSGWESSDPYTFPGGQDDSPWDELDGWVVDTTPPEISCPGDITVEAMGPDGVPIEDDRIQTFLAGASASDNCDPEPDIDNDAPDVFLPGETVVTFTATDISGNSSTCQSTVTVVEAAEGQLRIIPSIINRDGILQKILAVVRFPEGTTAEDIDIVQPILLYPGDSPIGIEATSQRIVTWYSCGTLRVSIFASFSKDEVTAGVPENGPAEMMVIGRFTSGQYFYGFDNVWIISWDW